MRSPLLAAGLLLLALPAAAQTEIGKTLVEVSVERPWPEQLGKGWFPVFVELENRGPDPREVRLRVETVYTMDSHREVEQTVELEPGQRRHIELLVPVIDGMSSSGGGFGTGFSLIAAVGSQAQQLEAGGEAWAPDVYPMVLFGRRPLDEPALATLVSRVNGSSRTPFFQGVVTPLPSSSFKASIGTAPFGRLAREWAAYSSLQAVALDLGGGTPDAAQVETLLRWVRLGGTLVLLGDPAELLAQVDALDGAFEGRFLLAGKGARTLHAHGLGRIYRVDDATGADNQSVSRALRDALLTSGDEVGTAGRSNVPSPRGWRLLGSALSIPGLGELPLRTFMVLLFLFAVLIGPINLMVLKRLGKPALLLVTIPVISAMASVGLLLYGVLYQGIDTKAARRSLTFLDQRTARASVVERRRLFVGLSQGDGLVPGAGTMIFPESAGPDDRFIVREDGGRSLHGSFLPVRDEVSQMVLTESSARAHLAVERTSGGLNVTNAFDSKVGPVVLRDEAGTWFFLPKVLEPGGVGLAEPYAPEAGENPVHRRVMDLPLYQDLALIPASYVARVGQSPFGDDCGLNLNVRRAEHMVYGVLDLAEESWR